ncbi:MAG TPA: riboflavin synthase [Planctomycetaceae bacterium]|nr:riboflavin synthase [Planctomycetaceae bacterium]
MRRDATTGAVTLFTGLVEAKGLLERRIPEGPGARFVIRAPDVADGAAIGDSIAISGCCLTVVALEAERLEFQAGSETLSRTNLGERREGDELNLERSLRVGDRMGGHFVTGHVDGLGQVAQRIDDADWSTIRFSFPSRLAAEIAGKGSITVDGVSLTVVEATGDWFSVALIPHTLAVTTLGRLKVGDRVNLETDVLAKYVRRGREIDS